MLEAVYILKRSFLFIVKSEFFWVIIIALSVVVVSIYPDIFLAKNTPDNKTYTFLHNSISDYPYYISFTRQGIYRNTTIDQFTSEEQIPGYVHIFYLLVGKIGHTFGLSPVLCYFFSRIILGFLFMFVSYVLLCEFIKEKPFRVLSFAFFIYSASFPKEIHLENGFDVWPYLFWWTETDPFQRATFIPHFLVGHIGLVVMVILMLKIEEKAKFRYFVTAVVCGFITGIVHPPSLGMAYYVIVSYLFINSMETIIRWCISSIQKSNSSQRANCLDKKFVELKRQAITLIVFIILTIPSLLYIFQTTSKVFPWTLMKAQESLFYAVDLKEYILSFGILAVFGFMCIIILFFKQKRTEGRGMTVLTLWVLIDLMMVPGSWYISQTMWLKWIPTFANIRFLSMAVQLPLSILASYFILLVMRKSKIIAFLLLLAFITANTPVIYSSAKLRLMKGNTAESQYVYLDNHLVSTYRFLDENTSHKDVVLGNRVASLLLPIFSGNVVYHGQPVYTNYFEYKNMRSEKFFSGKMESCEAIKFLTEGKIKYILTVNENEEKLIGNYPFEGKKILSIGSVGLTRFDGGDEEICKKSSTISD